MIVIVNLKNIILKNITMENFEFKAIELLRGGIGCDIVSGTGAFNARIGKISGISIRQDNSGIASIVEVIKSKDPVSGVISSNEHIITSGTGATGTRSYVGVNTLLAGEWIIFDNPVKRITPSAGSFIVYYQNI
jgi:hypothetical protein